MNSLVLALLCGAVGVALGVLSRAAVARSSRQRSEWAVVEEPALDDGAAQVLAVVGRAYVVVDAVDGVVRASQGSYAYGLVRGHSLVQEELVELVRQVRRGGVVMEKTLDISRGPLGRGVLVLHVRVAPLADEYILLLADDRTEISRAQAVRTDFVANVSHELKTPVGAVGLLAEAIEGTAEEPEAVRHFSRRLHKESTRLTALVHDIIELSRLQGTDVLQQARLVDLDALVHDAVDRNRLTAESKDIAIEVRGRAVHPVHGDPELLMTALRNLIDNAIRYSPERTRIEVRVRSRRGSVSVAVADQGAGIPEGEQERIFERFYRVDPARSRRTGGTGLGLSIVKHVMAQHGGQVEVTSRVGEGSEFVLTLPELDESVQEEFGAGAQEARPVRGGEPVAVGSPAGSAASPQQRKEEGSA